MMKRLSSCSNYDGIGCQYFLSDSWLISFDMVQRALTLVSSVEKLIIELSDGNSIDLRCTLESCGGGTKLSERERDVRQNSNFRF